MEDNISTGDNVRIHSVRIRSAVLAFFLGNWGVDMLLLGPHQVKLFMLLGVPFIRAEPLRSSAALWLAPQATWVGCSWARLPDFS
jgi:hypothetical protein